MLQKLKALLQREDGATAVEYSVMLALILMAVVAGIGTFGSTAGGYWSGIQSNFESIGLLDAES